MVSRRRFFALFGSSLGLLAGCSTRDHRSSDTPSETASPTSTDTAVPTETPGTPTDPSFKTVGIETTGVQCGEDVGATVTVSDSGLRVVGTIVAPARCYHASLRSASIRDGTADLDIHASDDPTTETPCEQCQSEVRFELRGTFVGGTPSEIVVELHGEKPKTIRKIV